MFNFIKKNYLAINLTLLCLVLYIIFFPLISKGLEAISPVLTQCQYKASTGRDCPLCGGTRYMIGLGQVFTNPGYLLHPFGFMMIGIAFELFFRMFCIYSIKKKKNLNKIIIVDITTSSIIVITFAIYCITFMLKYFNT